MLKKQRTERTVPLIMFGEHKNRKKEKIKLVGSYIKIGYMLLWEEMGRDIKMLGLL